MVFFAFLGCECVPQIPAPLSFFSSFLILRKNWRIGQLLPHPAHHPILYFHSLGRGVFGRVFGVFSISLTPPSTPNFIMNTFKQTRHTVNKARPSQFSSVAQSCLTLRPQGMQHARLTCLSPTPQACSNSCPLRRWWHPAISSSVVPFSSCLQSLPALGSFPLSQFFASGGQSIGASASASVLPMNIQVPHPAY